MVHIRRWTIVGALCLATAGFPVHAVLKTIQKNLLVATKAMVKVLLKQKPHDREHDLKQEPYDPEHELYHKYCEDLKSLDLSSDDRAKLLSDFFNAIFAVCEDKGRLYSHEAFHNFCEGYKASIEKEHKVIGVSAPHPFTFLRVYVTKNNLPVLANNLPVIALEEYCNDYNFGKDYKFIAESALLKLDISQSGLALALRRAILTKTATLDDYKKICLEHKQKPGFNDNNLGSDSMDAHNIFHLKQFIFPSVTPKTQEQDFGIIDLVNQRDDSSLVCEQIKK